MNVKNQYGKEIDFDEALKSMDADLRENVAYELSLSSDQEFFDKYAEAHKKKFGTTWEPDREYRRNKTRAAVTNTALVLSQILLFTNSL